MFEEEPLLSDLLRVYSASNKAKKGLEKIGGGVCTLDLHI